MNSYSTEPDSLDMEMDLDSDGIIQQLEIGDQWWSEGGLLQLIANGSGLTGSIPNSLGNLDTLFILDLSNNHLTGPIPESIDSMNSLWKLHLSTISFHQDLPKEISFIHFVLWIILEELETTLLFLPDRNPSTSQRGLNKVGSGK